MKKKQPTTTTNAKDSGLTLKQRGNKKDGSKKKEKETTTETEAARPAADGLGDEARRSWNLRASLGGEYQTEFAGPRNEMMRRKQER